MKILQWNIIILILINSHFPFFQCIYIYLNFSNKIFVLRKCIFCLSIILNLENDHPTINIVYSSPYVQEIKFLCSQLDFQINWLPYSREQENMYILRSSATHTTIRFSCVHSKIERRSCKLKVIHHTLFVCKTFFFSTIINTYDFYCDFKEVCESLVLHCFYSSSSTKSKTLFHVFW